MDPIILGQTYHNISDIQLNYTEIVEHVVELFEQMQLLQNITDMDKIFPDILAQYNISSEMIMRQAVWEKLLQQDMYQ